MPPITLRSSTALSHQSGSAAYLAVLLGVMTTAMAIGGGTMLQMSKDSTDIRRTNQTEQDLRAAARYLANQATDNGTSFTLPADVAGELPNGLPIARKDPFGRAIRYCPVAGAAGNNDAVLAIVSGGADRTLQTACGQALANAPVGDDRVVMLTKADISAARNASTSGGGAGPALDSSSQITVGKVTVGAASGGDANTQITVEKDVLVGGNVGAGSVSVVGGISGASASIGGTLSVTDINANGTVTAGSLALNTPLAIASGGTGAATAEGALTNLGGTSVGVSLFRAVDEAGARTALGAGSTGATLFRAADQATARAALGAGATGSALLSAVTQTDARSALGASSLGGNLLTATDEATARGLLKATAVGNAVFTAVDAAAGRAALGIGFSGVASDVLRGDGTWGAPAGGSSITFPLLATALGTAAAPAYSFSADPDTGLYASIGGNSLYLAAAGAPVLRANNSTGAVNNLLIQGSLTGGAVMIGSEGSDSAVPLRIYGKGGGNLLLGYAGLATNSTQGYVYIGTTPGTPSVTPDTSYASGSLLPVVIDRTNNKFMFYSGGAWREPGGAPPYYNVTSMAVMIGSNAGSSYTGGNLVAIGLGAAANVTNSNAIAIGANAGWSSNGISIGAGSAQRTTGTRNIAIGSSALYGASGSTAYEIIAIGPDAMTAATSAYKTVAIGGYAGSSVTTGYYNVYIGHEAARYGNGQFNTGLGYQALMSASGSYSAMNNTALGYTTLKSVTWGGGNTAVGSSALSNLTVGNNNVGVGYNALINLTSGTANVAVGPSAGRDTVAPTEGVAYVGGYAGMNQTGGGNVALGYMSSYGMSGSSTGTSNVTVGFQAGYLLTTGSSNTMLGYKAGSSIYTDSQITLVGANTASNSGFSNTSAIGYGAVVNASNAMQFGNSAVTSATFGGGTAGSTDVYAKSFNPASDRRLKHDITDLQGGLAVVRQLRPVSYIMDKGDGRTELGFIAQEVRDVPTLSGAVYQAPGQEYLSLSYNSLVAPTVRAVQELADDVDGLNARLDRQEREIEELKAALRRLQRPG